MAMVAERLREVIEMERDAAPPRPPLALVPSEPEHETAVRVTWGHIGPRWAITSLGPRSQRPSAGRSR